MANVASSSRLFFCYRRVPSEDFTLRLRDYLETRLDAELFVDTQNVRGGRLPWPKQLELALASSTGIIVVVGRGWVTDSRLLEPDDWVRLEILAGLSAQVPIYVVTVNDTPVLDEGGLPKDLAELAARQSLQIRTPKLERDAEELIDWICADGTPRKHKARGAGLEMGTIKRLVGAGLRVLQLALLAYLTYRFGRALADTRWSTLISSTDQPQAVLFGLEVPFVVTTILTPLIVVASDRFLGGTTQPGSRWPLALDSVLGVIVLLLASQYIWLTSARPENVCQGFCPSTGFAWAYSLVCAAVGSLLLVTSYTRWRSQGLASAKPAEIGVRIACLLVPWLGTISMGLISAVVGTRPAQPHPAPTSNQGPVDSPTSTSAACRRSAAEDAQQTRCNQGALQDCEELAWFYSHSGCLDYPKAIELHQKACDGHLNMACHNLGIMYKRAEGVTKSAENDARAVALFRGACESTREPPFNDSCIQLGNMYYLGRGVDRPDREQARQIYQQVCDRSVVDCVALANFYAESNVESTIRQGASYYEKICRYERSRNSDTLRSCVKASELYRLRLGDQGHADQLWELAKTIQASFCSKNQKGGDCQDLMKFDSPGLPRE